MTTITTRGEPERRTHLKPAPGAVNKTERVRLARPRAPAAPALDRAESPTAPVAAPRGAPPAASGRAMNNAPLRPRDSLQLAGLGQADYCDPMRAKPPQVDGTGPADDDGVKTDSAATPAKRYREQTQVMIGGMLVTGNKPTAEQLRRSVALSSDILERLALKLIKPGVQLGVGPDVPLYSADPEHPNRYVRELNGKIERGILQNGAFKVID